MYYVYLLQSIRFGRLYIGFSKDLEARFSEHNKGGVRSSRPYRPYRLVYYEAYFSERDARRREIELKKQGQQKELLKRAVENSLLGSKRYNVS